MQIISQPTSLNHLWENKETDFLELLKIVVDIDKEILAIDAEMHADLEKLLLTKKSEQRNLWGANVYPFQTEENYIEYTSFINIRPSQENRSMEVEDENICRKIRDIVNRLLIKE